MIAQDKVCRITIPFICVLLTLGQAIPAARADVVLVPGHITGNVQIGSEVIDSMYIYASGSNGTATQGLNPATTSAPYDLTVNVPTGGTATYAVRAYSVRTRDATSAPYDYDYLNFPTQQVTVSETLPITADFELLQPNYVEGTVALTGAGQLSHVAVYATPTTINGFSHYTTQPADPANRNELAFQFPASTGDMRCYGTAQLLGGATISLPSQTVSSVGGFTTCDWVIATPEPPEVGHIEGAIEFIGPDQPYRFTVNAVGSTFRNWTLNNPTNPADYLLSDLAVGGYTLSAIAYLNNGEDYYQFPDAAFAPSRNASIGAGELHAIDVSACQAFIGGMINLSGSVDWNDINSAYFVVTGRYDGLARGGSAQDFLDRTSGQFDLIVSPGSWSSGNLFLGLYNPEPLNYLQENLYIYDRSVMSGQSPAILSDCGATATRNFEYDFGTVTVNFSIKGDAVLSRPSLAGTCAEHDAANNLLYSYNFYSYNNAQNNVANGHVSFVAPQGHCKNVQATANVGGSQTTFGKINLEVIGGGEVVIDIGGPGINIDEPEAGLCIDGSETTVIGTATDDVGVASVVVNGITASLDPIGGEGTVSTNFIASVPLVAGANTIATVATDTSGNTGSDSRVVYRDAAPPLLSWTPANGATTTQFSVDVSGTVSDDVGIAAVTVNGAVVELYASGNPNEYLFSVPVALFLGANTITVSVTEETGCAEVVQVRQITVIENLPPNADAGGPYTVDEGGNVSLTGAASSDPDGDPLSFEWDFDYDGVSFDVDASGTATPEFSAVGLDGPSLVKIAVRVTDGEGAFDIAQADINVENVPPVVGDIIAPTDPLPVGVDITLRAGFNDDGTPDTHTALWNWGDGSTAGTVTQGAGNGSVLDVHTYIVPGVYTTQLTVTDDDSGSDTNAYQYVVVYNPNGSFVTGGGTIHSPPGAYAPDMTASGKANFGFVSKYQKGANVPSGHTEFQFHAAGMDFKSVDYQWLVIAGARAQFKGTGTIQGMAGSFGFFLTAIDGEVDGGGGTDKFRIKIWDVSDESNIIYDNEMAAADDADPTTVIQSGSIVIHSKGKK